jgi:molybdopterin synthase catalytic subunit
MIEVTAEILSPERYINQVKTPGSGCVVSYVGLIRDNSRGKAVASVTYEDTGQAASELSAIAAEASAKWPLENITIAHRIGTLAVSDCNLVVAIACAHREAGLDACRYVIDRFKEKLPTRKREVYLDGSVLEVDKTL